MNPQGIDEGVEERRDEEEKEKEKVEGMKTERKGKRGRGGVELGVGERGKGE